MLQSPPAQPGMREDEIDTPALVIDLDAFEYNLDHMAALLAPTGAKLRAHAKTHKSPVIALQQIARGAVGQCVQKVAEAEILAWGGVKDSLVSNEVVGAAKLARLVALARIRPRSSRSRRRPRRPGRGFPCWWKSISAPPAAACRRGRRRWPSPSRSPRPST